MSISESSPASTAQNPSINDSNSKPSKPKFKCSIRSMVSNFSAKRSISKQKPFDVQKNDHRAASSETTTSKSDDHCGALSLPLVCRGLLMLDSAFADAKKYMDHVDLQINQLHEKLKELQERGHSEGDIAQLWKTIVKLKMKIPSQTKIHSAVSNPHRKCWPNINNAEDEMMHYFYYKEPRIAHTSDSDAILKEFHDLPDTWRRFLKLFFYFPPMAIIKKRVIIYLWIGIRINTYSQMIEYSPENILDELIARHFLEPVDQKRSLVPDSCCMRSSVYHSLNEKVIFNSNPRHLDQCIGLFAHKCLVNVGEAIIDGPPEIFDTMLLVQCVYLGRWQSSDEHHIELADAKFLHGLKKLKFLSFLSLQGISLIKELPSFIPKLNTQLKILDLRACHNLEMIPENIGCLWQLTHLDMSECYFLVHMPESLARLLSLKVLKGFFLRHYDSNKPSCTLHDLSSLENLIKLNIYTSMNDFPKLSDLYSFERFRQLQKLTILWGGFSLQGESDTSTEGIILSHQSTTRLRVDDQTGTLKSSEPVPTYHLGLQKLDLQCFPGESLPTWVRPANLKKLKKLYIRGGPLRDIGQFEEVEREEQWTVEILKLKYLSELEIDWEKLRILFPKLISLHQVECPKLTNFPCDDRGVWMNKQAIHTDRVQLRQQFTTTGSSSTSNLATAPTGAQAIQALHEKIRKNWWD